MMFNYDIINQIIWLYYILVIQRNLSNFTIREFSKKLYKLWIITVFIISVQLLNKVFQWQLDYKWNTLIKILNFCMGPLHIFLLGWCLALMIRGVHVIKLVTKGNFKLLDNLKYDYEFVDLDECKKIVRRVSLNYYINLVFIGYVTVSSYLRIPLIK